MPAHMRQQQTGIEIDGSLWQEKKAKIYKRGWKTPAGPLSHASDSDTDSALAFWLCFCLCFFHTEDKQAKSLSPIGGHVCLNDKLLFVNRIK